MSGSTSPQKSTYATRNTSSTTLAQTQPTEQVSSPARASPLNRLGLISGPRRSKSLKGLKGLSRTRSEVTMSLYSETTSCEQTPQLPTSASELTLVQSVTGTNRFAKEDNILSSAARSLMHRSSRMILKGRTGKHSMSRLHDWVEDSRDALNSARWTRHGRPESDAVRPAISGPSNFQHIIHTGPMNAKALDASGEVELAYEFSAMHSEQEPSSELKGIEAREIYPSTPTTPATVGAEDLSTTHKRPPLRSSKSTDSFKRLSSRSFSSPHPPTLAPIPPPRRSSRKPPPPLLHGLVAGGHSDQESPTLPDFASSSPGGRPRASSLARTPRSPLSITTNVGANALGLMGIAQAVTTPDESACVLKSELASPLEDVPEEDDVHAQLRPRTSPIVGCRSDATRRMLRSGSDPVLPEAANQTEEIPLRLSRRVSGQNMTMLVGWEDDVDYCYEQGLEAEDLDSNSPDIGSPVSEVDELVYMRDWRKSARHSRGAVPLHHRRTSSLNKAQGLAVPQATVTPKDEAGNTMFTLSPSLVIPREYSSAFEEAVADDSASNHSRKSSQKSQLPMFTADLTADLSRNQSPRNSASQLTKYPSGASSRTVSVSSSKRTSGLLAENASVTTCSSSSISIPDLVHSARAHHKSDSMRDLALGSQIITPVTPVEPAAQALEQIEIASDNTGACLAETYGLHDADGGPEILTRKRSQSDSAGRVLGASSVRPSLTVRGRSTSSAPQAATTAKATKGAYGLFPPLDRIGAAATTTKV